MIATDSLSKQYGGKTVLSDITLELPRGKLVAFIGGNGAGKSTLLSLDAGDERQIDNALACLGLKALQERYLDELSGGQRQMAFIAMIVAQDTEYIMLDEPLNNLDMRHSVHIMNVLRQLVETAGKTVFVVIHDINFVAAHADHIIALKDGQIVAQGDVRDIIRTDVLRRIYGMDIRVIDIDGRPVCLYYS